MWLYSGSESTAFYAGENGGYERHVGRVGIRGAYTTVPIHQNRRVEEREVRAPSDRVLSAVERGGLRPGRRSMEPRPSHRRSVHHVGGAVVLLDDGPELHLVGMSKKRERADECSQLQRVRLEEPLVAEGAHAVRVSIADVEAAAGELAVRARLVAPPVGRGVVHLQRRGEHEARAAAMRGGHAQLCKGSANARSLAAPALPAPRRPPHAVPRLPWPWRSSWGSERCDGLLFHWRKAVCPLLKAIFEAEN